MGKTMGRKHAYVKKAKKKPPVDQNVYGVENRYIDGRTAYYPTVIDWKANITMNSDGNMVLPLRDVEAVLVENEQLRETLYANENSQYNRACARIFEATGQSTSHINRKVQNIKDWYEVPPEVTYRLLYDALASEAGMNFKWKKSNESKLNYVWRLGMLPLLSLYLNGLSTIFAYLRRKDKKNFEEMIKNMQGKQVNTKMPKVLPPRPIIEP